MHNITTQPCLLSQAADASIYRCYVNNNPKAPVASAVDVSVRSSCLHPELVAEMVALRYLLSAHGIAGSDRVHGGGIRLKVSSPEILKLAKAESKLEEMSCYAQFLQTRYLGIQIERTKIDLKPIFNGEVLSSLSDACVYETVESKFGPIILTNHALVRLYERRQLTSINDALKTMRTMLHAKGLHPMRFKEKQNYYMERYGFLALILCHKGTKLNFILEEACEGMRLVTVSPMSEDNYYNLIEYDQKFAEKHGITVA